MLWYGIYTLYPYFTVYNQCNRYFLIKFIYRNNNKYNVYTTQQNEIVVLALVYTRASTTISFVSIFYNINFILFTSYFLCDTK